MIYADRELKNTAQIAYVDFATIIKELSPKEDGYTIEELMDYAIKKWGDSDVTEDKGYHLSSAWNLVDTNDWEQIKDWKIVDLLGINAENGFYGCLIDTGGGNAILGFCGSEAFNNLDSLKHDWIGTDLALLWDNPTKQVECSRQSDAGAFGC